MLDLKKLEKYDTQKMHKIYDKWPTIAKEAFESNQDIFNFDGIKHIVFVGMGGSGAIGDIFKSILSKTNIYVDVVKGYLLPKTVDINTLVIFTSVSGNTIETLSCLYAANKIGCKIISFSSGGKMAEFCRENKIEYRIVTQFHSPRASFTSYLYTMLKILYYSLGINQENIIESINELDKICKNICSSNLTKTNQSLNLAEQISEISKIYYPFGLESAAVRFKNSIQENAKLHAMIEDIIESSHNGIVSWERKSNVKPILITGKDDYIKTKERWKIIKEFFQENKTEYTEIKSVEGNILSKIIGLIYILDYGTIYKAVLDGIDPSPVKSIDIIKNKAR